MSNILSIVIVFIITGSECEGRNGRGDTREWVGEFGGLRGREEGKCGDVKLRIRGWGSCRGSHRRGEFVGIDLVTRIMIGDPSNDREVHKPFNVFEWATLIHSIATVGEREVIGGDQSEFPQSRN
jgi:hypothetical protein